MLQKQDNPAVPNEAVAAATSVQRIYLTGFMGAGKSTVGALLAERMQWNLFDLDAVIEADAGRSVAQLFDEHGEAHFRGLELQTFHGIRQESGAVISLGGGAVETAEIRDLIAQDKHGALVFLEAPLAKLIDRCAAQNGGATRPLLRDRPLLQSRYEKRLMHYRQAHLTVATQDLNPEEVAATIMKHLAAGKTWK